MGTWLETITEWNLKITGETKTTSTSGTSTSYEGQGVRIYVEGAGSGDLPVIGDDFVSNYTGTASTSTGIRLREIDYKISHDSCTNGRTAILNYNSSYNDITWDRDTYGVFEGGFEAKLVQGQKLTEWAWFNDNTTTGGTGSTSLDIAKAVGQVSQAIPIYIPTGSFKIKITRNNDSDFGSLISDLVSTYAGKLNTTTFMGFNSGNVLLSSYSATKEIVNTMPRWIVILDFKWKVIPDINHDAWQLLPTIEAVRGINPSKSTFCRPCKVERNSQGEITSAGPFIYGYADLTNFVTNLGGDVTL